MGLFDKLCIFCQNKSGLNGGYYCELLNINLDKYSDLFKYGCDGGNTGHKYCPFHQLNK